MAKLGMDVDAIRALADRLDAEAQRIQGVIGAVDALVRRIGNDWRGDNAQRFVHEWQRTLRPSLQRTQDAVSGLATSARNNAAAQETVSGDGANAAAGGGAFGSGISDLRRFWSTADHGLSASQSESWGGERYLGSSGSGHLGAVPVSGSGRISAFARASEQSHAGVSAHGADASFAAAAGVGVAAVAAGRLGNAVASVSGTARAEVSARANADGSMHIGPDGAEAKADAGAFAGAQASASATGHLPGVDATAGVHGYAGIGAHADADAKIDAQEIQAKIDLGIALGVGAGWSFSVDIKPDEILNKLPHWW